MSDRECLRGPAVVVLPDNIDFLNADAVGERLGAAIVSGAAVVIVRRILALLEADQVMAVYPDLGAAVAGLPTPAPGAAAVPA
jgi:hypothetical protein